MIKKLLLAVVVVVAALVGYASTRPDTFRIERSATIPASPARLYAVMIDLRQWPAWSPWEKLDPQMEKRYSEPATGKGANFAWKGNSKAGAGRIAIVDAVEPSRIAMDLQMLEPFEARNDVVFELVPKDSGTEVRWSMQGTSNLVGKLMNVFMDMDSMVGRDFEDGLENLARLATKPAP